MDRIKTFFNHINEGYKTKGDFLTLGAAILDGETINEAFVKLPLKTMNRHGLIAEATGTGKTKTLQVLAENYPDTDYYDTADVLTSLGIGEALVSTLDEKGRPTPLAATMMRAPMSRMDILTPTELSTLLDDSKLVLKYNDDTDRDSAYEMLTEKIKKAEALKEKEDARLALEKEKKSIQRKRSSSRSYQRQNPIIKVLTSATFIRAVFGILKKAMK